MAREVPDHAAGAHALRGPSELYFRTYLHTVMPLHAALVEAMCSGAEVPLELATVLEDIGQGYIRLAEDLNQELARRDELRLEPEVEDAGETRIEAFVKGLVARAGKLKARDGRTIDGRRALEAFPLAQDAIRTALLIEMAAR